MSDNPSNSPRKDNWFENTFADGSMAFYALLFFFSLITWSITAFLWFQLYMWYAEVTEPTIIFTLPALFLPFVFYSLYRNASDQNKQRRQDPLEYLGNGDPNNGVVMIFIFVFWSILYWNFFAEAVSPLNVSIWGLLTIFGMFFIRSTLFRDAAKTATNGNASQPSAGVSASGSSKS